MPPEDFPTTLDVVGSVLLALTAAVMLAVAVIVARRGLVVRLVWIWRIAAAVFLAAALYRALGGEHVLTERLRLMAASEGWYDERQTSQALLSAIGVVVVAVALWFGMRFPAPWPERLTALVVVGYLVLSGLRLVSLHMVDSLLYRSLGPIHANWLLEVALLSTTWVCAILAIRRQAPTPHRERQRHRSDNDRLQRRPTRTRDGTRSEKN